MNRNIWGQPDTGDDINGSMTVYGDINIKVIPEFTPDPDDDDDDGEWEEGEEGGGNINVEGDVSVDGHIYIKSTHPDHNGQKKCVGELINGLDGRLTTAEGNISSLTQTVNNHTTQITNLTSRMDDAEGDIADNADEIAKMKASNLTVDDVLQLIKDNQPSMLGSINQPVILWAGRLTHNTFNAAGSWDDWPFAKLPHFTFASNSHSNGLMTIVLDVSEGYKLNVVAVHATQYQSGDTTDNIDNPYIKGRSDGAHWFECRVDDYLNTKKVYIREFHQGNGDNDTWYSDYWGGDGGGIQA
ncbi:MAG: hypothetical protein HDT42_11450, partial [Ruminococcaceae bacterium]|nr:hypothetical protein [Oscillospiraceae bacterium]